MNEGIYLNKDSLASCILIGIFMLVGIIGNTLMLRSLIKYKQLRIDIYVVFGGLALADIINLAFAGPSRIIYTIQATDVTTNAWCKISQYLSSSTGYVASYHIVILSVLRGIVLTNRGHPPPTPKHAFISSSVCWTIASLASIPFFFIYEKDPKYTVCTYTDSTSLSTTLWLEAGFILFLPLMFILCLYGITYSVGKRYFADSYSGHARRTSRLINAIVISFVVCQLPYQVLSIHLFYVHKGMAERAYNIQDEDYLHTLFTVSDYMYCMVLLGKCLRPVLYSKLADDLGESFDEVINCTICGKYYHTGAAVKRTRTRTRNASSNSQAPLTSREQPTEEIDLQCEAI
ncbi:hypothetical protein LOTGIDRAFT_228058 [Lottia gigantea]|uniref:G-protein coupled receptors family 1 profile domain-containing protein n=1 Tax=Lottia gigantea TaxID=225164 RepID=V4CSI8_LOTGI|nr:hypothetical protein LOTGIDRAFT_228058 [Lottia gigantea]ESP05500.1 hypothetical protein LOTGIDRAFT_228058 [Lottia gigantea]